LDIAPLCYSSWGIQPREINRDNGLITLDAYQSLWQDDAQINELLNNFSFDLEEHLPLELGFLNVYLSREDQTSDS